MSQNKQVIEQEMFYLRTQLERCPEGSHWEQRIISRLEWLKTKLKELEKVKSG